MTNINSLKRLIILKSSLETAAIGSYIVGIVNRLIFTTFLTDSFSNLALHIGMAQGSLSGHSLFITLNSDAAPDAQRRLIS